MQDSIFTKIIKGEIPCHKIYEDERVLAFLDIHPEAQGHTLLVPKQQIDKIYDLSDEDYAYLWGIAKKIARHYDATLGRRVTFKVIGTDVPHAHIHIVPYESSHQPEDVRDESKPDHDALADVTEKLRLS